jgi:hypothetical protein
MEAFQTTNKAYGQKWNCSASRDPVAMEDVPSYSEIGLRDVELKTTMTKYKQSKLDELKKLSEEQEAIRKKQLAEVNGQLTTHIPPKIFPVKSEDIAYPVPTLENGNPLYRTSNMNYGKFKPNTFEMPEKFFPRDTKFTTGFVGGNFNNNGLVTSKTPSNVHKAFDQ